MKTEETYYFQNAKDFCVFICTATIYGGLEDLLAEFDTFESAKAFAEYCLTDVNTTRVDVLQLSTKRSWKFTPMKTEITKTKTFSPVSITFTFESQEELDVMTGLFNTSRLVVKLAELGLKGATELHVAFSNLGGDVSNTNTTYLWLINHT